MDALDNKIYELIYNFCNELFDYFEKNSTMMWVEDEFVRYRLRELYKIKKREDINNFLSRYNILDETDVIHEYINLGKDFLRINDSEMAFYDEETNSVDYFYFCFMDKLCVKYIKLIQIQISSSNIINVPACNRIAREIAKLKPE